MSIQPYTTDQEWIAALKVGELEAWGNVPNVEAQIPATGILGLFYRWGKQKRLNDEDAKDVATEAGSRMIAHLKDFRGEGSFENWLRTLHQRILWRRVPTSQTKLRDKLERWLATFEQRGLEQQRFTENALQQLSSMEQNILSRLQQGQKTEQISADLGLSLAEVRELKSQGLSSLLENQAFMSMLIRVGNQVGGQKDKLAANIIAAFQELQEISVEDLIRNHQNDGERLGAWEILAQPGSEAETDLSDQMALLWACIDQLSPLRREIILITLRYHWEHTTETNIDEAIAQELGITPQLVRLRRFQAKKPLQACLERAD